MEAFQSEGGWKEGVPGVRWTETRRQDRDPWQCSAARGCFGLLGVVPLNLVVQLQVNLLRLLPCYPGKGTYLLPYVSPTAAQILCWMPHGYLASLCKIGLCYIFFSPWPIGTNTFQTNKYTLTADPLFLRRRQFDLHDYINHVTKNLHKTFKYAFRAKKHSY